MSTYRSVIEAVVAEAVSAADLQNAGSPPTIVQVKAISNGAASITLDTAPVSGNLLVAMSFNPTLASAGSGWTVQTLVITGLDFGIILTKVAGGSESTTQQPLSSAPGTGALIIWELSGQAATFYVTGASQAEQAGPLVIGPQLPKVIDTIALYGMGAVDNITETYNAIQDAADNTGTRKVFAGHGFAPGTAQLLGRVASTNGYKVATCLITA